MSEGSDLEKKYVCVCVCFHVHTHVWKRGLIGLKRSITNSSLIMEEMSENLATNVANRFSGGSLLKDFSNCNAFSWCTINPIP